MPKPSGRIRPHQPSADAEQGTGFAHKIDTLDELQTLPSLITSAGEDGGQKYALEFDAEIRVAAKEAGFINLTNHDQSVAGAGDDAIGGKTMRGIVMDRIRAARPQARAMHWQMDNLVCVAPGGAEDLIMRILWPNYRPTTTGT